MKAEEIMQALRLTAMGRCGHPLQEQLAEELAGVLGVYEMPVGDPSHTHSGLIHPVLVAGPGGPSEPSEKVESTVKRARKTKAD